MKEYTTNKFYKGINTDMSWLERKGDMLLDALNVRMTSKNNDGLFAANIKGNIEEFSLSPGFVPIGSTEYNGILFILSVNKSTKFSEIGTYPKPNVFNDPCEGDDPIIIERALFTTEDLNFSCEHQARVLARINFDKSINIYWTDNFNPIRSINTGFHSETGKFNNTYVSKDMIINGIIDVVSENNKTPVIELDSVKLAGSLKAGHYFFFVRYVDINFNTSSFLGMSPPVPIFNEQPHVDYGGGFPIPLPNMDIPYGLEGQEKTNKAIVLNVRNLDKSEGFFEIAYIYYYGQDLFETKLIDDRIPIKGVNFKNGITIQGTESVFELSLDEIITYKPIDSVYCKDILQIDNKLYLANTRGRQLDHPDIRMFFCKIKIREDNNLSKPARHSPTTPNPYGTVPTDVYSETGYFSAETYCFAGVPIFKGGFVGAAFPLTGYDNIKGLLSDSNFSGIFRFSDAETNNYFKNQTAYIKGVKFDTTDAIDIYNKSAYLQENLIGFYFCRAERNKNLQYQGLAVPTWSGFELQRGPVKDFNGHNIVKDEGKLDYNDNFRQRVPIVERAAPYIWTVQREVGFENHGLTSYQKYSIEDAVTGSTFGTPSDVPANSDTRIGDKAGCPKERISLGIFSFDYLIEQGHSQDEVIASSFIKKIGYIDDFSWSPRAPQLTIPASSAPLHPDLYGERYLAVDYPDGQPSTKFVGPGRDKIFIQEDLTYTNDQHKRGGGFKADTYNTKTWDEVGVTVKGHNYPTKINNGGLDQGLFYQRWNRPNAEDEVLFSLPLALPAYILVDLQSSIPANLNIDTFWNTIVNVYKQNPDDLDFNYLSFYDFKNTLFSPISEAIEIREVANISAVDSRVFYQGDCFVSRSYIKVQNKFVDNLSAEFKEFIAKGETYDKIQSSGSAWYLNKSLTFNRSGYGYGISIVTENAINPNYRHSKGRNTFYPFDNTFLCPDFNIINSPESHFYNYGYKRMLSPRQFLGIDILVPTSDNSFPTRIRPSVKHLLNSLKDGYLDFVPGDFKDFDFQYGPINAIISMSDQLFSFQDDAINLHPINERGLSDSTTTDTPFVLGESKGLTEFKKLLSSEYGTQHQWSIVKGERAIYGFDWNKQTFWRVTGQGFENLGLLKGCEKWIEDVVDLKSTGYSDILEQLPDNPVCNLGIHSVYDREFKEVITTFIFGEDKNRTLCFSEKADNFYGQQEPAFIEVVVNPKGEIAKHFDNLIINSNNREFDKITYTTQHQSAIQDPFLGDFWNRAVYREFQWKLPIKRADIITDSQLSLSLVESRIRGRYLIINLQYAGDQNMWVREIITAYTNSKA